MDKIKCIVTDQGIELLNKCQGSGTALEFTSVKSGSGSYDVSEDLRSKTALKEYKQTFDNFYVSREAEQVVIRSTLSNDTLTENYKVREIGIWAREKDTENEILYALSVTHDEEMADLMFTKEDNYSTSLEYNHYLKIDNDIEVTIVPDADNSLARMYIEFDKLKKEHDKLIKQGTLILEDNVEKIRYTDCGFQVKEKDDDKWKSAKVGRGYPPGNMPLFRAFAGYDKVLLKFKLPPNIPSEKLGGVMFRYRIDKTPQNINDGTLAHIYDYNHFDDEREIDVYIENLAPNTQYYFKAFPFTFSGTFNESPYDNYCKVRTLSNPNKEYVNINNEYYSITQNLELNIEESVVIKNTINFPLEIDAGKKYSIKTMQFDANTLAKIDPTNKVTAEANKIRVFNINNIPLHPRYFEGMSWKNISQVAKEGKLKKICDVGDVKEEGTYKADRLWQVIKIEDKPNGQQSLYIRLLKGYEVYNQLTIIPDQIQEDYFVADLYCIPTFRFSENFNRFITSYISGPSCDFPYSDQISYLGDLPVNKHNKTLFDKNGRKLNVFTSFFATLTGNDGFGAADLTIKYYDVNEDIEKNIQYHQRFTQDISRYANQPIYLNTVFPLICRIN